MNVNINKVKIAVMIPRDATLKVREALFKTKIGIIGNYIDCSTTIKCLGTFRPNEKAHPYIGTKNKLEEVLEDKLEVICYVENVKEVVNKIKEVHPYEEPAIDIIPLLDEDSFN